MKALLIDRDKRCPLMLPPEVVLIVDSAITTHGRPVFLPDFDSEWVAEFYLAAKISRLGKNISAKFADRYYETVTVAMRLLPVTTDSELRRAMRPSGVVGIFDNALTPGEWISTDALPADLTISVNDVTATLNNYKADIADAITTLSSYATLKNGDIIMPYRCVPSMSVRTGSIFDVKVGDQPAMSLKIH